MEIEKSPILITGCARSGTSMVGGVINICGAFGGKMYPGNPNNAKGMFENMAIRENVDKGYLKSINMDPKGQNPLPDTNSLPIPSNWRNQVERIYLEEGYEEGSWFYKGARSCLVWPVWHYAYPNAKWVIVRRRSADIATSCLNTGFMSAYSDYSDWIKWINHHEDKFVEMIQAGLNVKQIWPERMVKGNYEQLYEVIEWLGLEWKEKEVIDFIEPRLWKSKQKLRRN
jgi:hypothetical protein